MRVIAGQSRGRKLAARPPSGVRPTSDRVREAVFDMLWSMGVVEDAVVLDLFCGTGAMGIEALSRGASRVTFVDHERAALDAVRVNLRSAGLEAAPVELVRADLPTGLGARAPVDLAFCDPPYDFTGWPALLDVVGSDVVVCESDREIPVPEHFAIVKCRSYGGTLVTVVEHTRQRESEQMTGGRYAVRAQHASGAPS